MNEQQVAALNEMGENLNGWLVDFNAKMRLLGEAGKAAARAVGRDLEAQLRAVRVKNS